MKSISQTKTDVSQYNLQPYDPNTGDTTGFRDLQWYREQVYPIIEDFSIELWASRERLGVKHPAPTFLDIGCGNGRHLPFLLENHISGFAVDPICEIDDIYQDPRVWYRCCGFRDLLRTEDIRVGAIFLFGSESAIRDNCTKEHFGFDHVLYDVTRDLLLPHGFWCSVYDSKHSDQWGYSYDSGGKPWICAKKTNDGTTEVGFRVRRP